MPGDEEFQAVVKAIESLALTYPNNRFVVSSRIAGWRTGINARFKEYFVNDLNDAQISSFISTWYSAVEQNAVIGRLEDESESDRINRQRRAAKSATQLENSLHENPSIRALATNPMLLSIIALVHRSLASLPQERRKLYADCNKILLEQWDFSRGLRADDIHLTLDQKEAIMREIAFRLHNGDIGQHTGGREASRDEIVRVISKMLPMFGRPAVEAPQLLKHLIERSGILIERQRDVLAFSHLTFQEYFSARHLSEPYSSEHDTFLLEPSRLFSTWWREVILLYSGMIPDSSDFLSRIQLTTFEDLPKTKTRIAGLCLSEAVQIKENSIRQSIGRDVMQIRTQGEIDPGDAPLQPELLDYLGNWCKEDDWLSFAAVLTYRLASDKSKQRAVVSEMESMLESTQLSSQTTALKTLGQLPDEVLSESLGLKFIEKICLSDSEIRFRAGKLLERLMRARPSILVFTRVLALLESESPDIVAVGSAILVSLGEGIASVEKVASKLESLLRHRDWRVRLSATQLFILCSRLLTTHQIDLFFSLVIDSDEDVRSMAHRSLGTLLQSAQRETFIQRTVELIRNSDPELRSVAAMALSGVDVGTVKRLGVTKDLVSLFSDRDKRVRRNAAQAFQIFAEKGVFDEQDSLLKDVLENGKATGKACALRAMAVASHRNKTRGFVAQLLRDIENGDSELKVAAADSLGLADIATDSDLVIRKLVLAADDRNPLVRTAAILSLGKIAESIDNADAKKAIISALESNVEELRTAGAVAAAAFGARGDFFLPFLIKNIKRAIAKIKGAEELARGRDFDKRDDAHIKSIDTSSFAIQSIAIALGKDAIVLELASLLQSESVHPPILQSLTRTIGTIGQQLGSLPSFEHLLHLARRISDSSVVDYTRWYRRHWSNATHEMHGFPELEEALKTVALAIGEKALPALRGALQDTRPEIRLIALGIAFEMKTDYRCDLLNILLSRTRDEEYRIRTEAWHVVSHTLLENHSWMVCSEPRGASAAKAGGSQN